MGKRPRKPGPKPPSDVEPPKRTPEEERKPRPKPPQTDREFERLAGDGELRRAIDQHLGRRPRDDADIDKTCRRLFKELRERCPELFPPDPVETGQPGPQIDLGTKAASTLFRAAARKVSGDVAEAVWFLGDSELMVFPAKTELEMQDGRILVHIPVRCDQTGSARITVPFAVGSEKRPGGLLAAAPARPAGPAEIVELWADALTAFAWGAVLELFQALAAGAGEDADNQGLIPAAVTAGKAGLKIGTLARHGFDRGPR